MNVKTAREVLAKQLIKEGYINIVENTFASEFTPHGHYKTENNRHMTHSASALEEYRLHRKHTTLAQSLGANYLFLTRQRTKETVHDTLTPYVIISDLEKEILKDMYYKDVPEDIEKAMGVLEIAERIHAYRRYHDTSNQAHEILWYERNYDLARFLLTLPAEDQNITNFMKVWRYIGNYSELAELTDEANKGIFYENFDLFSDNEQIKLFTQFLESDEQYMCDSLVPRLNAFKKYQDPSTDPESFTNEEIEFIFKVLPLKYRKQSLDSRAIQFQGTKHAGQELFKEWYTQDGFEDKFLWLSTIGREVMAQYIGSNCKPNAQRNSFMAQTLNYQLSVVDALKINPAEIYANISINSFITYFSKKAGDAQLKIVQSILDATAQEYADVTPEKEQIFSEYLERNHQSIFEKALKAR